MKKLLLFVILSITTLIGVESQNTKQVGDLKSYLTPEQLAKYELDRKEAEMAKKLETYGKWVGVGGEVGTAIHEGLNAVVDVSDKFGKTDVGKFTLVMVAWKVMGRDVVRILLGVVFIIIVLGFILHSFKTTCIERQVVVEKKGMLWWKDVKYETILPKFDDGEGLGFIRILHIIFAIGSFGISYAIMFG